MSIAATADDPGITIRPRLGPAYRALSPTGPHRADTYLAVEGPRGTAKTRSILTQLMLRGMSYPSYRLALCRSTRVSLTQTVLHTLETQVFPSLRLSVPGGANRENRSSYSVTAPGINFEIVPLGLDDPQQRQRLLSSEWSGVYIAEGTEISQETAELVGPTMRHYVGDCPMQIVIDWNPTTPASWANKRAEPFPRELGRIKTREQYDRLQAWNLRPVIDADRYWKRIITRHQDNPGYWDLAGWQWTKAGAKYLRTLGQLSGHLRRRWLDGDWVAAEGSVYPLFNESNVWPDFPDGLPGDWPLYWGTDPGFDHPTAILWFTVTPTHELVVVAESVESGKGVPEHAAAVRRIETERGWTGREITRYADPQHAFSSTAQSKRTIAEQWRDRGYHLHPWPRTGDNMDGMVQAVREKIDSRKLIVCESCVKTIAALQSWSFARNTDGSIKDGAQGRDKYEEDQKDVNDVIRGLVALKPTFRPCGGSASARPPE